MDHPEIILVDKPTGVTSFGVLRKLKEQFGDKKLKLGHAGTLDPNASGLMIVGVGKGTKKLKEYVGLSKEYIAEILIGERRTTSDMEGDVVETKDVSSLSEPEIKTVFESMAGTLRLPVSAFSAVKKGGQPLYKKAHKGEDVGTLPLRDMVIYEAELLDIKFHTINRMKKAVVTARFFVDSGVYIRSLAEEVGKRLSYPAVLKNLRRTKVGEFRVEDAQY